MLIIYLSKRKSPSGLKKQLEPICPTQIFSLSFFFSMKIFTNCCDFCRIIFVFFKPILFCQFFKEVSSRQLWITSPLTFSVGLIKLPACTPLGATAPRGGGKAITKKDKNQQRLLAFADLQQQRPEGAVFF